MVSRAVRGPPIHHWLLARRVRWQWQPAVGELRPDSFQRRPSARLICCSFILSTHLKTMYHYGGVATERDRSWGGFGAHLVAVGRFGATPLRTAHCADRATPRSMWRPQATQEARRTRCDGRRIVPTHSLCKKALAAVIFQPPPPMAKWKALPACDVSSLNTAVFFFTKKRLRWAAAADAEKGTERRRRRCRRRRRTSARPPDRAAWPA